jgi:nucleoside-diphosphate-sugar epimerase
MKTVLVTGAAGYIGSVLVNKLLGEGLSVVGLDNFSFGGESLLSVFNHPNFQLMHGDVRNSADLDRALVNADSVVHLAAIVGDPACARDPELTKSINLTATLDLFARAEKAPNVKRFIFASTCSNYGRMEDKAICTETSALNPVSLYAATKVAVEKAIFETQTQDNFVSTVLRFSTVYGVGPRMRFDLTVNDFVREVVLDRELVVFGEQFWRPYCHVEDLARSCIHVLKADPEKVNKEVFGVGSTDENYQKQMIVDEMLKQIPDMKVSYVQKDEDPRDYRVDFTKISDQLGFKITRRVPDGIREVKELLQSGMLIDPMAQHYGNI